VVVQGGRGAWGDSIRAVVDPGGQRLSQEATSRGSIDASDVIPGMSVWLIIYIYIVFV